MASIVETAKKRFQRAREAYGTLREQAISDTRFVLGDSDNNWQWPEDVWLGRSTMARKPCLTVNITAQHCNQIENQIRQNRPSAKILPQDSKADIKTAEIVGGMLRAIQSYSNADTAHDIGAMHSIYGGEGYWRVLTEYESETSFDQVITIKSLPNPQLVYIDPAAVEPDRSDARWGIIFEDIPKDQATEDYSETEVLGWGDDGERGWCNKDTVRRAEYFWCEDKADTVYLLETGEVVAKSELPKDAKVSGAEGNRTIQMPGAEVPVIVVQERATTKKQWKWAKIVGGKDEPEEVKDWPGSYLPIITVVGKEVNVNGEIVRKGLVRDLKDPARIVNYSYSAAIESTALQTKTPWLSSAESVEGYEDIWGAANIENRAWLPWNAYDDQGNQLPKPERVAPATMPTAQVQMLQMSVEQMRAASGQQNANFGIKSEANSGIGIQRLKVQGDVATFHFPDNLTRALRYEARVIIDLIPKIYDRKRIVRIIGLDGTESKAVLDPGMEGPAQDVKNDPSGIENVFNPLMGRYDVAIDTGPSYQTQRQEAASALGELASKAPILMNAAPDLVFKAMDFPMSQEIADRLAKTVPPNLMGEDNQAEQQLAQATQAIQQMQQQDQMQQQVIAKMQQHIDQLELEKRGNVVRTQGEIQLELIRQRGAAAQGVADHGVNAYKAETDRLKTLYPAMSAIELQALVHQTVQETLAAQPLQPEMEEPTVPIPINPMDGNLQPASAGFLLPEQAATGANPGLGDEPNPEEGTSNV